MLALLTVPKDLAASGIDGNHIVVMQGRSDIQAQKRGGMAAWPQHKITGRDQEQEQRQHQNENFTFAHEHDYNTGRER